jgi:AraC-like DNA-binding protein
MQSVHIASRAVTPVVAALRVLGHNADGLIRAAGIDARLLHSPERRIAHDAMMLLWERARVEADDDQIGIHVAEAAPLESFDLHAFAMLASRDLRDAFRRGCRYQRLIHESTSLSLVETGDEGVLEHALPGARAVPQQSAEFLVTLWLRFARLISDPHCRPRVVCFAHAAPRDLTEHKRVFDCPITFASGRTAAHFPNAILDVPNARADPALVGLLDRYAGLLIEQLPDAVTLSGRVRTWLLPRLASGEPSANDAATAMHVSMRSLHRKLRDEGTTFRELLARLRHEQATRLLANPGVTISEVGFLLGFEELSSFHRAFKRWAGTTPASYRSIALASVQSTGPPVTG